MLKMDLCMALKKTQNELLNDLSMDDLIEWAAYKKIKPFGYDMDNQRIGQICAAIYNSAGKTYQKNMEWFDVFTPSWGKQRGNENSIHTLLKVFEGMAKGQKQKDKSD